MAGPWEKYANPQPAPESGPWAKYARPEGRRAIATTPGGGTIWEMPGGGRAFSSPNYSTTDPERIEQMMQGATPAQASMTGYNEQLISESPVAARAMKAVEGVPFVGSYADEAAGAMFGDQARDAWRATSKAMDAERPWQSTGLSLAGGVAGAVPMALAAGPGALANSLGGNMLRGAAVGAGEGAVRGFGAGEGGAAGRRGTALTDAALGGAVGAAVPAVAHAGGALARLFQNWNAQRRGIGKAAEQLGVSHQAGRLLSDTLGMDDPVRMRDALQKAGAGAMLADAGPSTQGALDAVIQSPGEGARLALGRIDDRASQAGYGLVDALMGGKQGPRIPPAAMQNRMAESARGAVNPAYQRAYGTPIDYASPEGMGIEELIGRIPPARASAAIKSATDRMIYDGLPSPQILASVGDDGVTKLSQLPNVMQLDYMKRAFDEVASDSADAITGRMTSDGAFASRIARDIREATKAAVPAYGDALEVAANDIRQRGAVRTGQQIMKGNTTVESALEDIAGASGAEIRAMRDGVMGHVDHLLGNVRAVASDPNIDARQAVTAFRELSSPNAKQKMAALFGDDFPGIEQALDEAGAALGLRARVATNSRTYGRQQFGQMLDDAMEPGRIASGDGVGPLATPKGIWQNILGTTPQAVQRAKGAAKSELADVLTRPEGKGILETFERSRRAFPINPNAGRGVQAGTMAIGAGATPTLAELLRRQLLQQ